VLLNLMLYQESFSYDWDSYFLIMNFINKKVP